MRMRYWLIWVGCLLFSELWGVEDFAFRVYLKDKGQAGYDIFKADEFLSEAAIERRLRFGIPVSEADFPIAQAYLDSLIALNVQPIVKSKWFSTVVVTSPDSLVIHKIKSLSIVDSVKWVWKGVHKETLPERTDNSALLPAEEPLQQLYGYAENQIAMLNGIKLHERGYMGQGMTVAIIDAGFMNVDRISAFESINLAGTYNAMSPGESVFEGDDHGTKVLSCMAANAPGVMIGTAPKASYWLIKSEDSRSEYPVEEDYWVAAVEFADSVGVDVISSSLGYFNFDSDLLNYDPSLLDGKTAFISQAAEKAAGKGILVVSSAGNEGNGSWEKITFPSDAMNVLTVGSINENKKKSTFSSVGFTADYRVKPDVVALGSGCTVIDSSGNIKYANGTSFSTPIVAGLGVCLWQALYWMTNTDIIALLHSVSSQYRNPDIEIGYGIPDVYEAYKEGQKLASQQ